MEFKKNDSCVITIEDIGAEGEGIGKTEGYTLFVKDAIPGDVAQVKIVKAKKNYAFARLEKVLTPSPFRVEARCPIYKQCGGCQIQAIDYEQQLEFKHRKVWNHLTRIGGFSEELLERIMEKTIGMQDPFHYRNKAQFPVGMNRNGEVITGFYAGRTHDIIANTDCALGVSENKIILEIILEYMKSANVSAYNEITETGLVRHVLIRKGFATGQIMVCLVINGKRLPKEEVLVEQLRTVEGMTSVSVSSNQEKTNVIMGKQIRTLWGEESIEDEIDGIRFRISPLSFYQVNPVQTEKIYQKALEYAELTGEETVWDLYCGIGTISLFLARKAKKVYGVEIIPQAIEDARKNAERNGITNTEFFVGKAEEVLPEQYKKEHTYAEIIVVDPPRKGCDEQCLQTMIEMKPQKIVYVSCDSATLARDLKILCSNGYQLKKVSTFDAFCQTVHVETVVLLTRCDSDA